MSHPKQLSVQLDPTTDARLRRLAKHKNTTLSAVIRECIDHRLCAMDQPCQHWLELSYQSVLETLILSRQLVHWHADEHGTDPNALIKDAKCAAKQHVRQQKNR